MLATGVALVMAQPMPPAPPQPVFPNCMSFLEVIQSSFNSGVDELQSVVATRDGTNMRTDMLQLKTVTTPATIQSIFQTSTGPNAVATTIVGDYMNGTVDCVVFKQMGGNMFNLPPLSFQGTGKCGLGQSCNIWDGTMSSGTTLTIKTLVSNNDIVVELSFVSTNPPSTMTARLTHADVCKAADPSLFVVPSGLSCVTMSSVPALSPHMKRVIAMHSMVLQTN